MECLAELWYDTPGRHFVFLLLVWNHSYWDFCFTHNSLIYIQSVQTSMPVLHATPAAFIAHSNFRSNQDQLRRSFQQVNPTLTSGVCSGELYPFPEYLDNMRSGALASSWALFEQQPNVMAEVRAVFIGSVSLIMVFVWIVSL